MDEYPVLVKLIDYPLTLEELEQCIWCGGNLFRVQNEWGILKDGVEPDLPRVMLVDINLYCGVCGKHAVGYCFYPENHLTETFGTQEAAKQYLREKNEGS